MTDERYAFVEDVKNRKNVARSGGKKGKSRYGCSLPVDYMTTKEKRSNNSKWISITYDRPISFDKFLAYSDDDKKQYLQNVVDNHGGTTSRVATMFGCTEAGVKKFRQDLGIKSPLYTYNDNLNTLWNDFLTKDEFLRKPMSSDDFKALDYYDQTRYISFLVETMGVTVDRISSELFGQAKGSLGQYLKDHSIPYYHRGKGYRMSEEKLKAWAEWLGKDDEQPSAFSEQIPMDSPDDEIQMIEEPEEDPIEFIAPVGPKGTENFEIEYINVTMTIYSMDQIPELLSKLPRAHHGSLIFNF